MQPIDGTRTHIGHVIYPNVHRVRREQVFTKLEEDSILVVVSNPEHIRSNDVEYKYRQNSDLFYLTGFEEPESAAMLFKDKETKKPQFFLFVRNRDAEQETWTGKRYGPEGAMKYFNPDQAFSIEQFHEVLKEKMETYSRVIFNFGVDEKIDCDIVKMITATRRSKWKTGKGAFALLDLSEFLHPFRLIKDEHEIRLMREAARISAEAHIKAMEFVKNGVWEYQLQSVIEHHFVQEGASGPAYPSIVGSGANATILHYTENNMQVKDGDLVLIDAGCEYQYYAADITRTFPVSGEFTNPQRELYSLVLETQKLALSEVRPGSSLEHIHKVAVRRLVEGMVDLGILKGNIDEIIEEKKYKMYYMHGTSHWLGIDVHDAGRKIREDGTPVGLEPGMVFTVEPGLYISPNSDAPEKYRGIGIRIEDDVLVTKEGFENLSSLVPTSIERIEELSSKK